MIRTLEEQRKILVKGLKDDNIIKSKEVESAFLNVPRETFVWPNMIDKAYFDVPLPLGNTGQTISAPHMIAIMLEELDLMKGKSVLEIGTGSGFNATLMAYIVSDGKKDLTGKVITVERIPSLVSFAKSNIDKAGYSDYVQVARGDGSLGYPPKDEGELYDKITITAASPRFPKALVKQLKVGGVILAPIGGVLFQTLIKGRKLVDGGLKIEKKTECVFVPLIGEDGYPINGVS
ncbi:MAG: protein-L-isoaspartate(D-aspartate) O-methyltransferase [Nitrososphaeria archaeon]|jgi:protein-L-isoaspartate(D-aspartate) O-methyltransferase